MARNYMSAGEVLTLTAAAAHTSGLPYRISGFNGVALISVAIGDLLTFRIHGIWKFALASVSVGDEIYITGANALTKTVGSNFPFGRATTATDAAGYFHCRVHQLVPPIAEI